MRRELPSRIPSIQSGSANITTRILTLRSTISLSAAAAAFRRAFPAQWASAATTGPRRTPNLTKVSPDRANGPGKATAVKWPRGLGGKGNEQVASMVRQTDGAIGYIELIYAEQNHIAFGSVKNVAGEYVKASLASTTAAAASA